MNIYQSAGKLSNHLSNDSPWQVSKSWRTGEISQNITVLKDLQNMVGSLKAPVRFTASTTYLAALMCYGNSGPQENHSGLSYQGFNPGTAVTIIRDSSQTGCDLCALSAIEFDPCNLVDVSTNGGRWGQMFP